MGIQKLESKMLDETATQLFGHRNKVINGSMTIDQRNGYGANTCNTSGSYPVDRFPVITNGTNDFTAQQDTTVPTGQGFNKSIKITVATAKASMNTNTYSAILHRIEGYNMQDLSWGTASAQPATLSFWVRSSKTGIYSVSVKDGGGSTNASTWEYTINSANTWEKKSIVIPGPTTYNGSTTNGQHTELGWWLCGQNTQVSTVNQWLTTGTNANMSTNQANLFDTQGATFYLTGVQLERGSIATSFDFKPYGLDLFLCQRYFSKSMRQSVTPNRSVSNTADCVSGGLSTYSSGASYMSYSVPFPVTMRTPPTVTWYTGDVLAGSATSGQISYYAGSWQATGSNGNEVVTESCVRTNPSGTWNANQAVLFYGAWTASAEL